MVEKIETNQPMKSEKGGKKETKLNKIVIEPCTCKNEFQDSMYGQGMRVKNSTANGTRCTVCRK